MKKWIVGYLDVYVDWRDEDFSIDDVQLSLQEAHTWKEALRKATPKWYHEEILQNDSIEECKQEALKKGWWFDCKEIMG